MVGVQFLVRLADVFQKQDQQPFWCEGDASLPRTRKKTWFLFPTVLTIGGKPCLDPAQKSSVSSGKRLEYMATHEEGAMVKANRRLEQIESVHPNAGGLDIGAREIYGCVPPDRTGETVKVFGTFTPDLQRLADWLVANQVDTVAMESTGVYWIPVFEILEARGLKVYLVNGRHVKHVPGRKSDVADCQWLQKLHALGLLTGSFRPDGEMCALRAYLRHRADLVQHRAAHVQHMLATRSRLLICQD